MRKRRASQARQWEEPSLVPMADMLSNTVGIMIFIFVFTVLTTSAASTVKVLPLEHETDAKAVEFLCTKGRVIRMDDDTLNEQIFGKIKKPGSMDELRALAKKIDGRRAEDAFFTAQVSAEVEQVGVFQWQLTYSIEYTPKENAGETAEDLKGGHSRFCSLLAGYDKRKHFAHFIVKPDGIQTFVAARQLAADSGFETGWRPLDLETPVRSGNRGQGWKPTPE